MSSLEQFTVLNKLRHKGVIFPQDLPTKKLVKVSLPKPVVILQYCKSEADVIKSQTVEGKTINN